MHMFSRNIVLLGAGVPARIPAGGMQLLHFVGEYTRLSLPADAGAIVDIFLERFEAESRLIGQSLAEAQAGQEEDVLYARVIASEFKQPHRRRLRGGAGRDAGELRTGR